MKWYNWLVYIAIGAWALTEFTLAYANEKAPLPSNIMVIHVIWPNTATCEQRRQEYEDFVSMLDQTVWIACGNKNGTEM